MHLTIPNITLEGILGLRTITFPSETYKGFDQKSLHIFLIFSAQLQ
jgi:hypothetical protein